MVGYDSKFKRDKEDDGWTLSVFMHWYDNEEPPENRKEAMMRLKDIIGIPEKLIEKTYNSEV